MLSRSPIMVKTTNPDILIREIDDQDIDQVIELWQATGVARPWNNSRKDISRASREEQSTILVAVDGSRIVATAMVGEDGYRGWAYYVAADPQQQGSGLGRMIMEAAESWLEKRGIWKMNLLVHARNAKALDFYERLGYKDMSTVCLHKVIRPQPA